MKIISNSFKHLVLAVAFLPMWVEVEGFHRLCSLSKVPVVALMKDLDTGEYIIADAAPDDAGGGPSAPSPDDIDDTAKNNTDGNLRYLRTKTSWSKIVDAIRPSHRKLENIESQKNGLGENQIFFARQCVCFLESERYCPVDKVHCGVPKPNDESTGDVPASDVGCFNQSSRTVLIRNAWPVVILWYGALVLFLLLTEQGRHTRNFIYSKLCNRNYNASMINRMLEPSDVFSSRFFAPFWRRSPARPMRVIDPVTPETEQNGNGNQGPPTELALKTKRYARPPSNLISGSAEPSTDESQDCESENSQEDISCAICFAPLEDGERVGALSCNHDFHVDCLKTWLSRRNVCPLCQTPNAAIPRYGTRSNVDNVMDGSESSNNSIVDEDASEEANNAQEDQPPRTSSRLRVSNNFSRHSVLQRRQREPPAHSDSWSGWHFSGQP
mmetsp:Transcript_23899/g.36933  ORF Transcript_23899/g.36933 Transcript_23899/m.36933 type:complete len:441 (+) Transcript_23899:281-1603(+)|eukprot:CAMPEP_0195296694 /NCGR_PEP_ID=MMETSP0707-20130614/19986_1 /TAXON_ID=33640 /ORGANISM="Asterionellopsis glacialis, Strain CCMP134" /LENGTH=440 /DNA_ID=CAMNT_0040358279 /DNA_START=265 /DNA_END=1587 /DNA_ORIENTATION=+